MLHLFDNSNQTESEILFEKLFDLISLFELNKFIWIDSNRFLSNDSDPWLQVDFPVK